MSDTITQESLPGAELNVPAASGSGAGETAEEVVTVKDLMKTVLNKDYPTDEAALKSLKDTFNYVGQAGQRIKTLEDQINTPQVAPELQKQLTELSAQVKQGQFYQEHPEFNTPKIKALISDMGGDPAQVVEKESFKTAAAAIKASAEIDENRSVLHSNPRLGIAQDNLSKAQEALKSGDQTGAVALGMKAIMEAYPDLRSS